MSQLPLRLREAKQLGFRKMIVPKTLRGAEAKMAGLEIIPCRSVRAALERALLPPEKAG